MMGKRTAGDWVWGEGRELGAGRDGCGVMQDKAFPAAAGAGGYGGSMAKRGWSPRPLHPPCGVVPGLGREGAAVGAELPGLAGGC